MKRRRRRRRRVTRKRCGGMVVMRQVWHVIRTIPAPGPPCERIVACALGLSLAANNMSRNCCSVRLDASCCQPGLQLPGSKSSMFRGGGLALNKAREVWLCPLQLPDKGLLDGPPTEPPILLQCQDGESAPLGGNRPNCSNGPALECASHFSTPTLQEIKAM